MDIWLIIGIVFGSILFIFLSFILPIILFKSIRIRKGIRIAAEGEVGEAIVATELKKYIDEVGGYLINDVILPYGNRTQQIDHILFAPAGVFVVETKNWGGEIFGKDSDNNWTQVIGYRYLRKHQHHNPVKQNDIHIKAVRVHTGEYDNGKFYNLVVLLQDNLGHIQSDYVVGVSDLLSLLKSIKKKQYTLSKLKEMYDRINYYVEHPVSTLREHVQNIRQDHPAI